MSMLIRLQQLTARATQWFLRRRLFEEDIEAVISRFADPVDNVIVALDSLLGKDEFESVGQSAEELTQAGVPAALARRVASADLAHAALDIIELAQSCERAVPCVADVFLTNRKAEFVLAARADQTAAERFTLADTGAGSACRRVGPATAHAY